MEIMCLNAWGGKLHESLLPYLKDAAPAILCLQEVVDSPATDKDWLTYRDGAHILPQRANFFRDVCAVLPDHQAIFCPQAQGKLWDDDKEIPSQFGIATFVHKALPIIGQIQGFVHKGYAPGGYGDYPRSRNAHGLRVYFERTNRPISVLHMHGLRDLSGKHDTPDRTAQAHRLLALNKQLTDTHGLSVICGDFNVNPESETLQILNAAGFHELVAAYNIPTTRTSHYKKAARFADYMLINDMQAVKAFDDVRAPEVSDHCPLILRL